MASSSDAAPRAALVLYGRVGTYLVRTQSLKMGQHGDPELWARAAASIKQHVVDPWRRAGGVDVFVQSWNPELTAQMREFWQPAAVDHAEQVDDGSMIPRHCPVRLRYCERTMWALLGMKRGLALRARYAAQRGGADPHATVLVMRHDVQWFNPLPPLRTDGHVKLWLAFDCKMTACAAAAAPGSAPRGKRECGKAPRGAPPSNLTLVHAPRTVLSVDCKSRPEWCDHSVNIDWWFAAAAPIADRFVETFDRAPPPHTPPPARPPAYLTALPIARRVWQLLAADPLLPPFRQLGAPPLLGPLLLPNAAAAPAMRARPRRAGDGGLHAREIRKGADDGLPPRRGVGGRVGAASRRGVQRERGPRLQFDVPGRSRRAGAARVRRRRRRRHSRRAEDLACAAPSGRRRRRAPRKARRRRRRRRRRWRQREPPPAVDARAPRRARGAARRQIGVSRGVRHREDEHFGRPRARRRRGVANLGLYVEILRWE